MKILQGGAPKSGNFWLYRILREVLARAGQEAASFIEKQPIYGLAQQWDLNYPSQASIDVLDITDLQCSYRISSIFRMPIDSLEDYVSQTGHVWTHSPICQRSGEVFGHFDKKLYIVRDPRDRAVSAASYHTSPYMLKYYPQGEKDPRGFLEKNLEALMREWVWHVYDHLRLREAQHIHILFYENLLNDLQGTLSELLGYLELDLRTSERKDIEKAVSFENLKKQNPKHLRTGRAGYWGEQFSAEQKERAERIAGPLLEFLGYGENGGSPGLPGQYTEAALEALKRQLGGG